MSSRQSALALLPLAALTFLYGRLMAVPSREGWQQAWLSLNSGDSDDSL